jgi:hypothetical protein
VTRASLREYAAVQRERYRQAPRAEKRQLLDEVVAVTGMHRKAAIRLLRRAPRPRARPGPGGRPRAYGPEVGAAAEVLWQASGRIGARRLHPFVPELLDRLLRCGELKLTPAIDKLVRQASRPTLARLLEPARAQYPRRGATSTHPGARLKHEIPIRTFAEWTDAQPGFLEVDLVAHCGSKTGGFYLCTLCAVDIATAWVELEAVWGKGQKRVGGAVHHVRTRLPMPLRGLDSDNGSEFINHALLTYCRAQGITFTRSRPWKKNDSAHVEQKNGAVVRQLVGYDRFTARAAYGQLQRVYRLARLHVNFFQPVEKLVTKTRQGGAPPPRLRPRPNALSTSLRRGKPHSRNAPRARGALPVAEPAALATATRAGAGAALDPRGPRSPSRPRGGRATRSPSDRPSWRPLDNAVGNLEF